MQFSLLFCCTLRGKEIHFLYWFCIITMVSPYDRDDVEPSSETGLSALKKRTVRETVVLWTVLIAWLKLDPADTLAVARPMRGMLLMDTAISPCSMSAVNAEEDTMQQQMLFTSPSGLVNSTVCGMRTSPMGCLSGKTVSNRNASDLDCSGSAREL
jgi:hypothetical protein